MHKRGMSVTIFILLGVIILIIAGFGLYMRSYARTLNVEQQDLSIDTVDLERGIEECLTQTLLVGMMTVGERGGYYPDIPEPFFLHPLGGLPYYAYDGVVTIPEKEVVEESIANYIEAELDTCASPLFSSYPYLTIHNQPITAQVAIGVEDVRAEIEYNLIVKEGEKEKTLKRFDAVTSDIRLDTVLTALQESRDAYTATAVCTSCLRDIAEQHDLFFTLYQQDMNTFSVRISDLNSKFPYGGYEYYYAVHVSGEENA